MRKSHAKLCHLLPHESEIFATTDCLCIFLRKFFLRTRLIEDVILLIHHIDAPEAILAALAIGKKCGVAAVLAVFGVEKRITIVAVDALVAPLTVEGKKAVDCVLAAMEVCRVIAILIIIGGEDEITVFISRGEVRVIAVFILESKIHGRQRHLIAEVFPLIEERPAEIERTAVGERIPLVGVPFPCVVNHIRLVGRVNGDDLASRKVALAVI